MQLEETVTCQGEAAIEKWHTVSV